MMQRSIAFLDDAGAGLAHRCAKTKLAFPLIIAS